MTDFYCSVSFSIYQLHRNSEMMSIAI